MNHDKLMCDVSSIKYDYDTRVGHVNITYGCTDMTGTIGLFQNIDPKVKAIYTVSMGTGQDTIYLFTRGEWRAYLNGKLGEDHE